MSLYQLKLLADMSDIGEPGPLPQVLQGSLSDESLADLSWLPPEVTGYEGQGFFPYTPPPPPPPRRLIPKSTVQERVNTLGKWEAVIVQLYSDGLPNIYYGRWFAPDWPNVYADDEAMLYMLATAGCTEAEIEAITAP